MHAGGLLRFTCAVALVATAMSIPASAQVVTPASIQRAVIRRDSNDTLSPLDLRRVRLIHTAPLIDELYLTAWNPVTDLELDPQHHGNFIVGIDVNNRPRRFEYLLYLFASGGRIHGVLYNPVTKRATGVKAARLSPRSFRLNVPLRPIGAESYRFAVFGYYFADACATHHCTDAVPNRFPLPLQDLAAPLINSATAKTIISTDTSADLTYSLPFTYSDDAYGSGTRAWRVEERTAGAGSWTIVQSGASSSAAVLVPGTEGTVYSVRVSARDRAGNRSELDRTIVFPFDDQDAGVATYTGAWTHASGTPTSYMGTTSSSTASGDVASFSFVGGSKICLLGMPTPLSQAATVVIDSSSSAVSEGPTTPPHGNVVCWNTSREGAVPHTITVTVAHAPDGFVIDGLVVVP